jgi:hypothetical protein
MKATVKIDTAGTAAVLVKIAGLTDSKMGGLAERIATQAKSNVASIAFENSKGEIERSISFQKIKRKNYQIQSDSDHSSYIEFGTQFIKGKNPFMWPAYRTEKKAFFSGGKWV